MLGDATGGRAFASSARIRILLVPVGGIAPEEFVRWCDHVSSFETMRLADLPRSSAASAGTGAGGVRSAITGAGLAAPPAPGSILHQKGEVHLSFVTSHDPSHSFLAPFNMHRQVLGVLGLASYDTLTEQDRNNLERMPSTLRELCPGALIHRVYAFDTGAARPETVDLSAMKDPASAIAAAGAGPSARSRHPGTMTPSSSSGDVARSPPPQTPTSPGGTGGFGGKQSSGLVVFPAVRKDGRDVRFYLRTLLPNYVGALLDGLHTLVTGLEGLPLETPRETLDGMGTSSNSVSTTQSHNAPAAFGAGLGLSGSASTSAANAPQRKTMAVTGAGPTGTGRIAKVKADYALLTGDLWTALSMYDKCLSNLGRDRAVAGGQDAVWYAGGLEGWAVARVLVARMGGDVEAKAPSLLLPTGTGKEKDKKEREKEAADSPYAKQPWADIAEALSLAVTIYSKCLAPPSFLAEAAKSASNETPRDYTHPLLHASACISHARFLLAVWASEGWNGETFDQLMYGGTPPALANDSRPTRAKYTHFCRSSGVQRHEIASAASQALTNSIPSLKPPMQIGILSALASLFGCVGFIRREAYLLRQVQAVVISLIARTIALQPRREKSMSTRLSRAPQANGNGGSDDLATMITSLTVDSISDTAESVLVLALQVCETLGINLDQELLRHVPRVHILCRASDGRKSTPGTPLLNGALRGLWTTSTSSPTSQTRENVYEGERYPVFGWPEQQLALLRDTISVAELFSDHVSVAFFSALMLRQFQPYMSIEEQELIIQSLRKTIDVAKWTGAQGLQLAYWGPSKPLKSLEFVPLPPSLMPAERSHSELRPRNDAKSSSKPNIVAGLGNPFFWNPVRSTTGAEKVRLVQDERAEFIVTLQNPLSIHLDFTSIKLSTTGIAFDADEVQASIPPGVTLSVKLSGTPRDTGKLSVRGCVLTLAGCAPQEFLVPLEDDGSNKAAYADALEVHERLVKTKRQGLEVRPTVLMAKAAQAPLDSREVRRRTQPSSGPSTKPFLNCVVLPAQPKLRVTATSLRGGVLRLFDGQVATLTIQLANSSALPVDYARFQFQDDRTTDTLNALSEGELLPTAAYDAEWDLINRPTFDPSPTDRALATDPNGRASIRVPANDGTALIRIRVRGKLGASRAQIHIDYGHVDGPGRGGLLTEEARNFHTRRLTLPFRLEVKPVLEYGPVAILPAWAPDVLARISNRDEADAVAQSPDETCLLCFRVWNAHAKAVAVEVEMGPDPEGKGPARRVRKELAPGSVSDLVIPHARLPFALEPEPVPSLGSSRQFVVSRQKLPPAEERRARAKFWRTQPLYERLEARWSLVDEPGVGGEVRLRTKRAEVADASIDVLAGAGVDVVLGVRQDGEEVVAKGGEEDDGPHEQASTSMAAFRQVKVGTFVHLTATLRNRTQRPLSLVCRFVPHVAPGGDVHAPSSSVHAALGAAPLGRPSSTSSSSVAGPAAGAGAGAALSPETVLTQHQILCACGSTTLTGRVRPCPLLPSSLGQAAAGDGGGDAGRAECVLTFAAEGEFSFGAVVEEVDDTGEDLVRVVAPRALLIRAVR